MVAELLPLVLLILLFLVGLIMVPFGLPGLWVMVLALLGYAALGTFERVGPVTIAATVVLAGVGEALEAWIGFRYARRYGGSSRAGWGAIAGGLIGTAVGTPVPVIGNLVGAFLGAFVGAALAEHTRARDPRASVRAGWGAVLGRAAAAATKVGLGLAIGVIGTYAALG